MVLNGLDIGDRIVVDGLQRVHADALVSPQEAAPSATAAADNAVQTALVGGVRQNGNP